MGDRFLFQVTAIMVRSLSLRRFLVLAAALLPAACAYTGDDLGNPLVRKAQWFSAVAGDDIRQVCQPGAPDRFRLTYNGQYARQVRVYDVDSASRTLTATVSKHNEGLLTVTLDDPLAPWRAEKVTTPLGQKQYGDLLAALTEAGQFGPPAVGLELPSGGYYWVGAFCRDGRYGVTGWLYPSPQFSALRFPALLFGLDMTGIPVAEPAPVSRDLDREQSERRGEVTTFTLKIGENGLVR